MSARPLPRTDLDIAAELTRQLDESDARNAKLDSANGELQRQVEDLRRVLLGMAEDLSEQERPWELRGSQFWFASWANSNRIRGQLTIELEKHKQWHAEHGEEATRLQSQLAARDKEIGELTRGLHLARAGERCDSAEVD